ncbi:MAG TPA: ABC transporter substrate-binding protein [Acidimicrobiales bacterium]|nr:ABC transporter substrate-binding protein [Acidimicrobiales bacterium]
MLRYRCKWFVAVAATVALAGACSSSSSPKAGSSQPTYTIGILTDVTGPGSSTGGTTQLGIKAGVGVAAAEGYKIRYVMADTGTSPSGVLTAAQKLVEQDHVFAVVMISVVGFGAAQYLTAHNVPVIGAAVDGPEWITSRNMFSILGTQDYTKVQTTYGLVFKRLGATNIASVGYSIEPSSAEVAKGAAVSAQAAGLKVGYLNANFPLGSTNTDPVALAMKNNGVNGLVTAIVTNSTFAIVDSLRHEGADLRVALLPTGYGGDLIQGGPGAEQSAQGLYFLSGYEPVEMHTAATQRFQHALATYAGVSGDPTLSEYLGYLSVDGMVAGLKAAGPHPTPASFINAMLGIRSYDAAGLYGSHSIGFAMDQRGQAAGADNCLWLTKFSGSTFHLVPGYEPICGTTIPGARVSG